MRKSTGISCAVPLSMGAFLTYRKATDRSRLKRGSAPARFVDENDNNEEYSDDIQDEDKDEVDAG